jgi:hypothetical protein
MIDAVDLKIVRFLILRPDCCESVSKQHSDWINRPIKTLQIERVNEVPVDADRGPRASHSRLYFIVFPEVFGGGARTLVDIRTVIRMGDTLPMPRHRLRALRHNSQDFTSSLWNASRPSRPLPPP